MERVTYGTALLAACAALVLLSSLSFARNALYREGLRLWEDVLQASPNKARPHYNIAFLHGKRGDHPAAMREFETAVALAFIYPDAHNNLGIAYRRAGRTEDAVREFEIALQQNPDPGYPNARLHLGEYYASRGRFDDALREIGRVVEQRPDSPIAHLYIGRVYAQQDQREPARRYLVQALRLDPGLMEARVILQRLNAAERPHP